MTTVTSTETITITEADGTVVEVSGPRGPQGATGAVGAAGADADVSALLVKANDLSDLTSASTARTNLGLGTMATATASDYLSKAGNLGGIADPAAARTNLGLGTMATQASSAYALLAGAAFTGPSSFSTNATGTTPLTVNAYAASTVDTFTVRNSGGAKIGGWDRYGQLNTQYLTDVSGGSPYLRLQSTSLIAINQGNAANNAFAIRGMAAQSGHLLLCENSSSAALASISAAGVGTFAGITTDGAVEVGRSTAGRYIDVYNGDATNLQRLRLTTSGTNAVIQATRGSGTVPNLIFKIDGAERMNISSDGVIGFGTLAAPVASISAAGAGTFSGITSAGGTFSVNTSPHIFTGAFSGGSGGLVQKAISKRITSAGSVAQFQIADYTELLAGYTGDGYTYAGNFENNAAGVGAASWGFGKGNFGLVGQALATTTGHNIGAGGYAIGGVVNIGFLGVAPNNKNNGTNVGVVGFGLNGGTSPTQVGGYFALTNGASAPTLTSAALICDNVATTSHIFVARDNGTPVFTIADGGALGFFGGAPVAKPTGVAVSAAAIHAALVTLNLIAA